MCLPYGVPRMVAPSSVLVGNQSSKVSFVVNMAGAGGVLLGRLALITGLL